MVTTMLKGEAWKMAWEDFLVQLKREYCSEKDMSEISKEFQNLKQGDMSISEYAAIYFEKMKLVSQLIATESSKVERFSNGLPTNFVPMVKLATTLEATI